MQIIFGSENAELLRNRHVVLELEAFDMGQGTKAAYCVLPQDAIPVEQLADLARLQRLHQGVVDALKRGDNALVLEGIQHLRIASAATSLLIARKV